MAAGWTEDQLDRLAAAHRPRRKPDADGAIRLTHDEAARTVAALLFYLRAWEADPTDADRSVPTRQLVSDAGHIAGDILDAGIFPAEVSFDAEQVWMLVAQQHASGD